MGKLASSKAVALRAEPVVSSQPQADMTELRAWVTLAMNNPVLIMIGGIALIEWCERHHALSRSAGGLLEAAVLTPAVLSTLRQVAEAAGALGALTKLGKGAG